MDDAALIENEDLGSAHTRAREVRGEVLTGPERRRRWSLEEKLRILAQSVAPGSSASLVCRLHGISSGRSALHMASEVPLWRTDRPCAGDIGSAGGTASGGRGTGGSSVDTPRSRSP